MPREPLRNNEVPECVDLTVDEDCPEIPIRFGESPNTTRLADVGNERRDMAADARQVVIQLPFSTEDAVLSMFDHLADNSPDLLSHNVEQKHSDSLQPEFQHVNAAQQESSLPDAAAVRGSSSLMTGAGLGDFVQLVPNTRADIDDSHFEKILHMFVDQVVEGEALAIGKYIADAVVLHHG